MNKGLIFGLGFAAGACGAGLLANTMLRQAYAQKADEQIAACRDAFLAESAKFHKAEEERKAEEAKAKAAEAIRSYSPEGEKAAEAIAAEETPKASKDPYEITELVYEDPANPYKAEGLTYFPADGVVMRGDGTIMDKGDIIASIGMKALSLFDDDDTERVLIRNDGFQVDYEIVLSSISYAEWLKRHPATGK